MCIHLQLWFEIKSKPSCPDGSRHLFHMICLRNWRS